MQEIVLSGTQIRLTPLTLDHVEGLVTAANEDSSLYQWSLVPRMEAEVIRYIETALAAHAAGTAVPFAIVRTQDQRIIGSTRFWNLERWPWPLDSPQHGVRSFDVCEIGHTWLARYHPQ